MSIHKDWRIVEKKNHLAVHGYFMSERSAQRQLREVIPDYCRRGFYIDKTLTPDDFEILPPKGE